MCKKCDEQLAPVKAKMGEMTRIEEITAIAALTHDLPLEELIRVLELNRAKGVAGSFGAPPLPDEVVNSERTIEMAMQAMKIAAAMFKASKAEATDDYEDMKFDEETIIALLGFELNEEQSKEALELALRGVSVEDAFQILSRHHPLKGKITPIKAQDPDDGKVASFVPEEQFDAMMSLYDTARHRAAAVAHDASQLRLSIIVLHERLAETVQAGGSEKGVAWQMLQELKTHVINKNPEVFAGVI